MPDYDYEYEDLGNGLARVVDASGNEQLVTTLPNALEMGIPQVGGAPAVNPNPMDVVDPATASQPMDDGYTPFPSAGYAYDSPAPPPVPPPVQEQPDPGIQLPKVDIRDPLGRTALPGQGAPQQPTQQPTQDDPSAYTQGYTPRQQAPQGPQYATATTRNKQTSTTKTLGIDEDIKAMDEAGDKAADAIEKRAAAQANAASKVAAIRDTAIEANEKTLAAVQERRQRGAAAVEERMQNLERFKQEYADAVEAGKASYWSDKSTGNKVMATIGLMFGAMGQAYTGQNIAQQLMQVAMEDEYRRERDKVADAGKLMRGEFDMLSAVKSQTSDDIEGMLLERDLKIQGVQSQIRQVADELGGLEAFPKAQEAVATLEMERAKLQAQMRDRVTTTEQVSSRRVPVSGGGAGGESPIPGTRVLDPSKPLPGGSQLNKARDLVGAANVVINNANTIVALRKKWGGSTPPVPGSARWDEYQRDKKHYESAQLLARGGMAKKGGMGSVMSDRESAKMDKIIGGDMMQVGDYMPWASDPGSGAEGLRDTITGAVQGELAGNNLQLALPETPSGFRPITGGGG